MNDKSFDQSNNEIVVYQSVEGDVSFNVNVFDEDVWLTQQQIAELFGKGRSTITEHISKIFEEGELDEKMVCRFFRHTTQHGSISGKTQDRKVKYYNLDVIISVGYRVKSKRGIQFRQWSTKVLKKYMINGYAVNEARVKKMESAIDELVSSQRILKEDVEGIKNLLVKLIERPIVIHSHHNINNQIGIGNDLERSLVNLLDQMIKGLESDQEIKEKIEDVRKDIIEKSRDSKSQKRVLSFFKEVGDAKSDTHKALKGAGIAKNIITETIMLGEKIKEWLM